MLEKAAEKGHEVLLKPLFLTREEDEVLRANLRADIAEREQMEKDELDDTR